MVISEKERRDFVSPLDGYNDHYIIEHPVGEADGPLVMYLHSGLCHADQGFCMEDQFCFNDLRREVLNRNGIYVSPEYRGNSWMNAEAETDVYYIMSSLMLEFNKTEVILVGASMGGASALIFASHHSDIIKGVISCCPATDTTAVYNEMLSREALIYKQLAKHLVQAYKGKPDEVPDEYIYRSPIYQIDKLKMPVVIRHGTKDKLLKISYARDLYDGLIEQGTKARFDELPEGNHTSPTVNAPWSEYLDFVISGGK